MPSRHDLYDLRDGVVPPVAGRGGLDVLNALVHTDVSWTRLGRAYERAGRLLQRPARWRAVEALASALLELQRLEGDQARQIVEAALRRRRR